METEHAESPIIFCKLCNSTKNFLSLIRPCNCYLLDYVHDTCLYRAYRRQNQRHRFSVAHIMNLSSLECQICKNRAPVSTGKQFHISSKTLLALLLLIVELGTIALLIQIMMRSEDARDQSLSIAATTLLSILIMPSVCAFVFSMFKTTWRFVDVTHPKKTEWISNEWIWQN